MQSIGFSDRLSVIPFQTSEYLCVLHVLSFLDTDQSVLHIIFVAISNLYTHINGYIQKKKQYWGYKFFCTNMFTNIRTLI